MMTYNVARIAKLSALLARHASTAKPLTVRDLLNAVGVQRRTELVIQLLAETASAIGVDFEHPRDGTRGVGVVADRWVDEEVSIVWVNEPK